MLGPVVRASMARAAVALAFGSTVAMAQSPHTIRFARNAGVASDGRVAFTYQDDIWVVDADGSHPHRLTVNVARDFSPRFSPDSKWIAFTSSRTGNNDVFVVPAAGGEPRQLTWYSGNDQALYWTPDGTGVVLATARGTSPWGSPLYVQPVAGGIAQPLGMGIARAGMISQDGALVAFNRNLPSTWRKGYRGNAAASIAVLNTRTHDIAELTNTDLQQFRTFANNVFPMWGADGMIYFASERDGTFNLWRIARDGGTPQQVTHFTSGGVFFPAISPDGRHIVFQNDFDLYTLDVPAGRPNKLEIALAFDPKEFAIEALTTQGRADGFSVSPAGDYLAVDYHGEIMIVPTDTGVGEKAQVTSSAWRDRGETYSPDGERLAYVSDEGGEQEVWVYDVGARTRTRLTTIPGEKSGLVWSPDGQKIAFECDNKIFEVAATGGAPRELAANPAGGFSAVEYAAGGRWLAYSRRDAAQNADVFLYDIAARKEYDVAPSPWNESNPRVTPDGNTVVFTSNRDGGGNQLFAVSLARLTEDPNDPLVRERERRAAMLAGNGRGGRGVGGNAAVQVGVARDPGRVDLTVELDGIDRRAIQLTRGGASVSAFFFSRDGRTVYYSAGGGGGRGGGRGRGGAAAGGAANGLYSVSLNGRARRRIAAGTFAGMQPTADRRAVFFRAPARAAGAGAPAGGRGGNEAGFPIRRLAIGGGTPVGTGRGAGSGGTGGGANAAGEAVPFSFTVRVDRRAEWKQILDESYRVMKYRYYDPSMHGRNWAAIYARYAPLLDYAGTNEDVYDIANAMIGELSSSHTGVRGPSSIEVPRAYTTRYLGFEMEPVNGKYRVSHVYRGGPADKEWIGLRAGDYVLAIDGHTIAAGDDYWKILSQTQNEYVPVTASRTPDGAGAKTYRIATVASLTDIRYEEWVENNRDSVEKATNGRIAYVHIRAMNQPSLQRFENEIDRFWQKEGIIVDIRNNSGGNIDQQLLDILERQPYQFWNSRTGARAWGRRPRQAIVGPKVMMTNYRSVSDAEVTPAGFRALGLGRIVGNPTSAQVIATGSYGLINGGTIRTPGSLVITWDPTRPNNYGVDLENFGVPPDVWVRNSLTDEARGVDRELRAAIDEALEMLKKAAKATSHDR